MFPILEKITQAGFEYYLVGGYVRDLLLNKISYDVDVTTNASIDILKDIFKEMEYKENGWCLTFSYSGYHFEITPYRKEAAYSDSRHPDQIFPCSTIQEDSQRRDFTINALYFDNKNKIYDFYGGIQDLKEKQLKTIKPAELSFQEDPLRMLRALRFQAVYHFNLSPEIQEAITKNKSLFDKISFYRKKQELEKIFYVHGISILYKWNLEKYFHLPKEYHEVEDITLFWAQLDYEYYPFSKKEKKRFKDIQKTHTLK